MQQVRSLAEKAKDTIIIVSRVEELVKHCNPADLAEIETICLSADYPNWEKLGLRPTYYCTADADLLALQHGQIKAFIEKQGLEGAFLAANLLDYYPQLQDDRRYLFLEQAASDQRLQERLLPYNRYPLEHPAFKSAYRETYSTAIAAIRYAAYLGYRKIALPDIDLAASELFAEKTRKGGLFRYKNEQRAAEKAPEQAKTASSAVIAYLSSQDADLFSTAFFNLRNDFYRNRLQVDIVNCNQSSVLHKKAVFPYQPLHALFGRTQLGAVAVPTNIYERQQLLFNLWLWDQPGFAPFSVPGNHRKPRLVYIFNNESGQPLEAELKETYYNTDRLQEMFSGLDIHYLSLHGEDDTYETDYTKPFGRGGYKVGPNNQFFLSMELLKQYGHYAFLMESDCVPIRPNWLAKLSHLVDQAEPFWIMGAAYRGKTKLERNFWRHINGNAVYAVGDSSFHRFIEDTWRPALDKITSKDPRIAYDCALEVYFNSLEKEKISRQPYKVWQDIAHKLRYTNYIQNISTAQDLSQPDQDLVRRVLSNSPDSYIIHCKAVARSALQLKECPEKPEPVMITCTA